MSGSKTSRKNGNTCKHVFIKGKREGEVCGAPSRGDFCKNHNQHRKDYTQKFFDKKAKLNLKDKHKLKVRKLKKMQVGSNYKISRVKKMLLNQQLYLKKWEELGINTLAMILVIKTRILGMEISKELGKQVKAAMNCGKANKIATDHIVFVSKLIKQNKKNPDYKEEDGFELPEEYIIKFNKKIERLEVKKNKIISKIKQYKEYILIIEKKITGYYNRNNNDYVDEE